MDNPNNTNPENANPNAEAQPQAEQPQPTQPKKSWKKKLAWIGAGVVGIAGGAIAAVLLCKGGKAAAETATEATGAAVKALMK